MFLSSSTVSFLLPIGDADRAQSFYSDKLALAFEGTNGEGSLLYRLSGGAQLVLLPRPDQQPSSSTAMSFEVGDVAGAVAELGGRGVAFEDYDLPDLRTVDHVAEMGGQRAAWFKDPHGNVLCVHQIL